MNMGVLSLIIFLLFIGNYPIQAQEYNKQKRCPAPIEMLSNSAQGREFWIAIPPNEVPDYNKNVLEIYVTSSKRTMVTLSNLYTGLEITKRVEPMQITSFSTANNGEINWDLEVRKSEQITSKGLHLEADQPISVYVLNAKTYSSDGYMALPVTALGKEYYHLCYWDFNEQRKWGSGFVIVGTEDWTKVTIRLNGRGKGLAKTVGGHDIGDVIRLNLNQGQTYMVRGNGETRGVFDLSGTRIASSKPIGLISFHMRTMIPAFDLYNGRDHLCEMLPPVHAWGKKYVTVEYKRETDQGDFFRVIAAEDETHVTCNYYDKDTGEQLGMWDINLKRAGDWEDYLEVFAKTPNKLKSIRGVSVWTADKPVLLMQYSYSEEWDKAKVFDPFMIVVTPEEQFASSTIFQTPGEKSFVTNWLNIVARHNPDDEEFEDLKSIKIDGIPITQMEPRFTYNKIPTTNMYWATVPMQPGAHHIIGNNNVKFGGSIYGFSTWDSYGWPAVMAINKLDEIDTLPPVLTRTMKDGKYIIDATEHRNGSPNDQPRQVDQGIVNIELLDGSYNFDMYIENPNPFKTYPPVYDAQFILEIQDFYKNAFAKYAVTDRAGNFAMDSISYTGNIDTLPPVVHITKDKDVFTVDITEHRNGSINDVPRQFDSGIEKLVTTKSTNINFQMTEPDTLLKQPPVYEAQFVFKVINKEKDASAYFIVYDNMGNSTIDSIYYKGVPTTDINVNDKLVNHLYDVRPNPVSGPNVIIKYSIANATQTKVELFNSNSESFGILVNDIKDKGLHEFMLSTENFPAGVYFVRITTKEFSETKPLVITK